jgi:hypothetical protein
MTNTIKNGWKEIGVFSIYMSIAIVFFSTIMFYVETTADSGNTTQFVDIPAAFYWAIITMTLV